MATIPVGDTPSFSPLSSDGSRLYVPNILSGNLSVIDTGSNGVIATITIPDQPYEASLSVDGTLLFVPSLNTSSFKIVDVDSLTVVADISLGGQGPPQDATLSLDGQTLYTPNRNTASVSVIDLGTFTLIDTIPVGASPRPFPISPDGLLYVPNQVTLGSISVIDTSANTVIATVTVGSRPSRNPVISADGALVFVPNFDDENLSIVDTETLTVIATVTVTTGPQFPILIADGSRVYVPGTSSYYSTVIDVESLVVIATIPVPGAGFSVNSPDGRYVYSGGAFGQLFGIDTTTFAVNPPIQIGFNPTQPVLSPSGTKLYIPSQTSDVVSVVDISASCIPATGKCKTNKFLTQIELFNQITWEKPVDTDQEFEYRIFTDSSLTNQIGTVVSSDSQVSYIDHNKRKRSITTYYIQVLYPNGEEALGTLTVFCD